MCNVVNDDDDVTDHYSSDMYSNDNDDWQMMIYLILTIGINDNDNKQWY